MSFEEPYKVVGIERRTRTIIELWLERSAARWSTCRASTCCWRTARAGCRRGRSRCQRTRPDGLISLLVTGVPGGETSTWIHERLRVGEEVRISGPTAPSWMTQLYVSALFWRPGLAWPPIRALLEAALRQRQCTPIADLDLLRDRRADVIDRGRLRPGRRNTRSFASCAR